MNKVEEGKHNFGSAIMCLVQGRHVWYAGALGSGGLDSLMLGYVRYLGGD